MLWVNYLNKAEKYKEIFSYSLIHELCFIYFIVYHIIYKEADVKLLKFSGICNNDNSLNSFVRHFLKKNLKYFLYVTGIFSTIFYLTFLFLTEHISYLPVPSVSIIKYLFSVWMKSHYCDIFTHFPTKNDRTEWRAGWNWYHLDLGLNPGLDL